MVIIDKMVVMDTMVAERDVSPPNFSENIVVAAATGEEAAIVHATKISPVIPQSQSPKIIKAGNTISLNTIDTYADNPFILKLASAK